MFSPFITLCYQYVKCRKIYNPQDVYDFATGKVIAVLVKKNKDNKTTDKNSYRDWV